MNSTHEHSQMKNQVAVVTGGGRGIGRAIAQTLAAAGAKVAVLARSENELAETVRLIEQAGGQGAAFPADATSPSAVQAAFARIEQLLGPVDVLVSNAGMVQPFGPLHENDVEQWWRSMEINLRAPALCAHAVLPGMVARRRGRIVNMASGAGTMCAPFFSSYVTGKTALIRFSECLALEYKPHGVSVFSISPGTVRTAMSEYSLLSPEGQKWLPWFRRIFDENIIVPAERSAHLVLELASGRADSLSGSFLTIYDDLDKLIKNADSIDQQTLYSLKVDRLPNMGSYPVISALADARRAADKMNR